MNVKGQYAFDLFFNAGCSFMAGIVIIWVVIKLFRVDPGRWKLALYFFPFLKIIWDLTYRRIPQSSIIFSGIDPLSLPPRSQTLTIGAGMTDFTPFINVLLNSQGLNGKQYATSAADYLYFWLHRHLSPGAPLALLVLAALLSLTFIFRRVMIFIRFEKNRKIDRIKSKSLMTLTCGRRSVDVYLSSSYAGTPFTGGIFNPYICFPEDTHLILSPDERNAVVAHELGHIKQWDLIGTFFIQALGDLFWFIPGYKKLSRKIDRLREILADRSAVESGTRPELLAASLLKLKEKTGLQSDLVLYSAFFRESSALKERVELLMGEANGIPPRFGWKRSGIKLIVTTLTLSAIMISTFGGNHEVSVSAQEPWTWMDILPRNLAQFLKKEGFH